MFVNILVYGSLYLLVAFNSPIFIILSHPLTVLKFSNGNTVIIVFIGIITYKNMFCTNQVQNHLLAILHIVHSPIKNAYILFLFLFYFVSSNIYDTTLGNEVYCNPALCHLYVLYKKCDYFLKLQNFYS